MEGCISVRALAIDNHALLDLAKEDKDKDLGSLIALQYAIQDF